jgi:hypothetical protein
LTEAVNSGVSIEADTSLAIVVFEWEITVGVDDNSFVLGWEVCILSLVSNDGWFSDNPALSLEECESYTDIRLVFISNFACTSVPSPIRVR